MKLININTESLKDISNIELVSLYRRVHQHILAREMQIRGLKHFAPMSKEKT